MRAMLAVDTFVRMNERHPQAMEWDQEFEDFSTQSTSFRCDELGESDAEEPVREVDPWDWPEPDDEEEGEGGDEDNFVIKEV